MLGMNKKDKKIEAEKGAELKEVAETKAIKAKKIKYTAEAYVKAVSDLSLKIDNAFFKHPFNRCPDCAKNGSNAIMAHYGIGGNPNKIGNLKGFNATIGDVITWTSNTYKGLSAVKAKHNGVFELVTSPFYKTINEPAVIEKMLIPANYLPIIEEMARFLTDGKNYKGCELVEIGEGEYPNVIAEKL